MQAAPSRETEGQVLAAGRHNAAAAESNGSLSPGAVAAAERLPAGRVLFDWQKLIRDDETLTTTAKAIAWAISTRMTMDGAGAHPSLTTIQRDTRCSRRTVMRVLNALEARGYLIRNRPSRKGPKNFTAYVAAVPDRATETPIKRDDRSGEQIGPREHLSDTVGLDEIGPPATPDRATSAPLATPSSTTVEQPLIQDKNRRDEENDADRVTASPACPACGMTPANWCGCTQSQKLAASMPWAQVS